MGIRHGGGKVRDGELVWELTEGMGVLLGSPTLMLHSVKLRWMDK